MGGMTNTHANKQLVDEFIQRMFTKGDLTAVDDCLTPDFVVHDPPFGGQPDAEGMRAMAAAFRTAFPDWHSDVHLLIAEDDLVAEMFTASGTQRGEMLGVAPTGRPASLPGTNVFRVRDGRISEFWPRVDELGLLQQLGLAPRVGA